MSALEVIHTCPPQRKALFFALGVGDDSSSSMIKFKTHGIQPRFPYYVSLLIHVECLNNTIMCIVIDEGVASSMMYLACWKGLGYLTLSKYVNILNAFDGISFQLHGIPPSLEFQLGWNTIVIEVEVVDAPLTIIFYWVEIGCTICKS